MQIDTDEPQKEKSLATAVNAWKRLVNLKIRDTISIMDELTKQRSVEQKLKRNFLPFLLLLHLLVHNRNHSGILQPTINLLWLISNWHALQNIYFINVTKFFKLKSK